MDSNKSRLRLEDFESCPLEARFINTAEDARSYYLHRLVGRDYDIEVDGRAAVVWFDAKETHAFTSGRGTGPVIRRAGAYEDARPFDHERARFMDAIIPTLRKPAVCWEAKLAGGVLVIGPPEPGARRIAVVVGPERRGWFIRTFWPMSADDYRRALKNKPRAARWPP